MYKCANCNQYFPLTQEWVINCTTCKYKMSKIKAISEIEYEYYNNIRLGYSKYTYTTNSTIVGITKTKHLTKHSICSICNTKDYRSNMSTNPLSTMFNTQCYKCKAIKQYINSTSILWLRDMHSPSFNSICRIMKYVKYPFNKTSYIIISVVSMAIVCTRYIHIWLSVGTKHNNYSNAKELMSQWLIEYRGLQGFKIVMALVSVFSVLRFSKLTRMGKLMLIKYVSHV